MVSLPLLAETLRRTPRRTRAWSSSATPTSSRASRSARCSPTSSRPQQRPVVRRRRGRADDGAPVRRRRRASPHSPTPCAAADPVARRRRGRARRARGSARPARPVDARRRARRRPRRGDSRPRRARATRRRRSRLAASLGVLCADTTRRRLDGMVGRAIEERLVARGVLRRARRSTTSGRPLLVTRNDPLTGLANGMTGVVVADDDGRRAVFEVATFPRRRGRRGPRPRGRSRSTSPRAPSTTRSSSSLPGADSPLLTRELVYTAVTRSRGAP